MTHTKGPWKFEPQDVYLEYERVTGKIKPDHEKYSRENDGNWIVVDADGQRVATARFQGTAKRGQGYNAPDPDGMANACLIAAAPELLKALARIMNELPAKRDWLDPVLEKMAREAIKKATGNHVVSLGSQAP